MQVIRETAPRGVTSCVCGGCEWGWVGGWVGARAGAGGREGGGRAGVSE